MIEIDFSRFPPGMQEQLRTVQFGLDVQHFVNSEIGQYLLARAAQERAAALEELAYREAADIDAMRELQQVVRRADGLRQWLLDASHDGDAAEAELQIREGE